jgi:hypothetical protein
VPGILWLSFRGRHPHLLFRAAARYCTISFFAGLLNDHEQLRVGRLPNAEPGGVRGHRGGDPFYVAGVPGHVSRLREGEMGRDGPPLPVIRLRRVPAPGRARTTLRLPSEQRLLEGNIARSIPYACVLDEAVRSST